ncbi:MAG: S8 family serine peptidase [Alphaproteobacteria bacterium]|nr:S8 family serine peptidase [Alphaproteobacteria bacterium]MCB9698131.1 S8 family serine peptidase [Alphaproteobacteria bacterium]
MLALVLSSLVAHASETSTLTPDQETAVRALVREIHDADPDRVEIIGVAQSSWPTLGLAGTSVKLWDPTTDRVLLVEIDPDLRPLPADLGEQEAEAWSALHGTMEPDLEARLATAGPDELLPLVITLRDPGPMTTPLDELPTDPGLLDPEELSALSWAFWTDWNAPVVAPAMERLAPLAEDARAARSLPMVFGTVRAGAVAEIAAWPDVVSVALDRPVYRNLRTVNEALFTSVPHGDGIDGTSDRWGWEVQVGVVEVGGWAPSGNPFVPVVEDHAPARCATPDGHTHGVVGVIGSLHPDDHGVAPAARLWVGGDCAPPDASGSWSNLLLATERSIAWGARIVNHSWGGNETASMGVEDRTFDRLVARHRVTQVVATGNHATFAGSPSKGYNVVSVGAYDDHGTASPVDDTMADFSNHRDAASIHHDREQPTVVAPGVWIQTTREAHHPFLGWMYGGINGTSFAAPAVTGVAALMASRDPLVAFRADVTKSILVTSAVSNIEDDARISERDGAGGVRADWADAVVKGEDGGWEKLDPACASTAPLLRTVHVEAGHLLRASIAWTNDPDYDDTRWRSEPAIDADLRIRAPDGTSLGSSASFDRTWEVVHAIAPVTGDYELEVRTFRCDDPRRNYQLGLSWLTTRL